jgi:hypothetical protein
MVNPRHAPGGQALRNNARTTSDQDGGPQALKNRRAFPGLNSRSRLGMAWNRHQPDPMAGRFSGS